MCVGGGLQSSGTLGTRATSRPRTINASDVRLVSFVGISVLSLKRRSNYGCDEVRIEQCYTPKSACPDRSPAGPVREQPQRVLAEVLLSRPSASRPPGRPDRGRPRAASLPRAPTLLLSAGRVARQETCCGSEPCERRERASEGKPHRERRNPRSSRSSCGGRRHVATESPTYRASVPASLAARSFTRAALSMPATIS